MEHYCYLPTLCGRCMYPCHMATSSLIHMAVMWKRTAVLMKCVNETYCKITQAAIKCSKSIAQYVSAVLHLLRIRVTGCGGWLFFKRGLPGKSVFATFVCTVLVYLLSQSRALQHVLLFLCYRSLRNTMSRGRRSITVLEYGYWITVLEDYSGISIRRL